MTELAQHDMPRFSVIVPFYNEKENIAELHKRLVKVLRLLPNETELLYVNDASTDGTSEILKKLTGAKIITLRKNSGQSAAFDAGIRESKGEVLITLDGDLQNPPEEIPNVVNTLLQNWESMDYVCGWRKHRKDPSLKRWISLGARFLRGILVKDGVHDAGCSLRAYKRDCFEGLVLQGEMHRFLPALLKWRGFRAGEVVVKHDPRMHGETKYNAKRVVKGFVDMINIWFWRKYQDRPMHIFGLIGILLTTIGSSTLFSLLVLRITLGISLSEKIWPLVGFTFLIAGLQSFMFGIVTDIVTKTYYSSTGERSYRVRSVVQQ